MKQEEVFIEFKIFSWFGGRNESMFMRWSDWKGKQEVPSGWSFKIGKWLKRAD